MTKINLFINILFLIIAIIINAISQCSSALSDKRLCYNPDCSEPVSLARTTIKYTANEPGLLNFDISAEVKVYSKGAGNRTDLWGVEINGKYGYVPKLFLKEYKVFHKKLSYEVPINQVSNDNVTYNKKLEPKENDKKSTFDSKDIKTSNEINLNLKSIEELPHNVTPSYEIIDGTALHLGHDKPSVQSTFVTETVQTTMVPNKEDPHKHSEINSNDHNIKSSIFTNDEKLPQKILKDDLKVEEQNSSNELNIEDFSTGNKHASEILNTLSSDKTEILEIKGENEIENFKNNSLHTVKDTNVSENKTDTSVTQTPSSNTVKENLKIQSETALMLDEKSNIDSNKTVIINNTNINTQHMEDISIFGQKKDVQFSDNVTLLGMKQDKSRVESKNTDKLINVSPLLLKTNVTDTIETTSLENVEESIKNISKLYTKNENDKKTEQSHLKEEIKNSEYLNKHKSNQHITSLFVESSTENAAKLTLSPNVNKDEEKEKMNAITDETLSEITKMEITSKIETVSSISQNLDSNLKKDINLSIVTSKENEQEFEKEQHISHKTYNNTKEINEIINETVKADNVIKDVNINNSVEIPENIQQETYNKTEVNATAKTDNNFKDVSENNYFVKVSQNILHETFNDTKEVSEIISETTANDSFKDVSLNNYIEEVPPSLNESLKTESDLKLSNELLHSTKNNEISESIKNINEFHNRNLLNIETSKQFEVEDVVTHETDDVKEETLLEHKNAKPLHDEILHENMNPADTIPVTETVANNLHQIPTFSNPGVCTEDSVDCPIDHGVQNDYIDEKIEGVEIEHNYWLTLIYLSVTATATLLCSLGYYYIENIKRDKELIARINKLEKDLLVATKESIVLSESLKVTKEKLIRIEDESFGSNEMVQSLKSNLETVQNAKTELEDQVTTLEKDLESATEAGLELERMLREVLSSNNEVNPLAQSVEDLQARLNAQQAANESLTNALNVKTHENESLSTKITSFQKEYDELQIELSRVRENLKLESDNKNSLKETLSNKVQQLEMQIKEISTEKATLQNVLKAKEVETKDLLEVINRLNSNNLDLDKLYDVSHIKAEATALLEERNELKIRLVEIEGAHNLLEEHMKVVKEEIGTLREQCKVAEKEKKDAETRLEVLANFFEEKEAQRQKEEAIWLQQQGEVVSTVERIQTMQNEIQNYKQQIEVLKREILDQEREYKSQISVLETKAHEQWVIARQVERRLEESKVEAGQLRNRLTLIEKNINDSDSEAKLHRLEANGEATTSPPLFLGAESSSSPIMFSGSTNIPPPPPPSYLHSLFPPYMPPPLPNTSGVPPYEVNQRPPPLGGRLSSPPPMPLHPPASSGYNNAGSPLPPMSPHLLPPCNHRSPPPPPFGSDIHPLPPPPPGSILPPPLGTWHSWGEESLLPPRNSGFHLSQRERVRNHKGSLHSSGESLDKTHHNSKV